LPVDSYLNNIPRIVAHSIPFSNIILPSQGWQLAASYAISFVVMGRQVFHWHTREGKKQ
jgi:hypothetical protein